jgi:hypothetical protein
MIRYWLTISSYCEERSIVSSSMTQVKRGSLKAPMEIPETEALVVRVKEIVNWMMIEGTWNSDNEHI